MSKVALAPIASAEQWMNLLRRFADANFRQGWSYAVACAERRSAQGEFIAIERNGQAIGAANVRVKPAPLLGTGVAYISGGPLSRTESAEDLKNLEDCLGALRRRYVEERGYALRILPPPGPAAWTEGARGVFSAEGFGPTERVLPYRTLMVDLEPALEAVRGNFAQKWRNCLNNAERRGLTVRTSGEPADMETFRGLFNAFVDRKGFDVDLDADFYGEVLRQGGGDEGFVVTLAELNGTAIAGHFGSLLGDTCVYLLGATSEEGLKQKGAYLLQWHVMKLAKERGMRWYDLGGIDPEGNPGVFHFKSGMGGQEVRSAGPFELLPGGARRHVLLGAERAYRSARDLKRLMNRVMAGKG